MTFNHHRPDPTKHDWSTGPLTLYKSRWVHCEMLSPPDPPTPDSEGPGATNITGAMFRETNYDANGNVAYVNTLAVVDMSPTMWDVTGLWMQEDFARTTTLAEQWLYDRYFPDND